MSVDQLPAKYDLQKFSWVSVDEGNTQSFVRPLAGTELPEEVWHRYARNHEVLFMGVSVNALAPISQSTLISAARQSWIVLRYEIPTIASTTYLADDNDTYMLKYTVASSTSDVQTWADRTFVVHNDDDVDLNKLRADLSQVTVPSPNGDQTWLHFVVGPSDSTGSVTKFGVLFHSSHSPFDGSGAKIIVNKFLAFVAEHLHAPTVEPLAWGKEGANLVPAVFDIMGESEPRPISIDSTESPTLAHPYYSALVDLLQNLAAATQNNYGLRPRDGDPGVPFTKRKALLLSKSESENVFNHLKSQNKERGYTLGVVAHAAVVMMVGWNNPPTSADRDTFFNLFGIADCRHLLVEPWNNRNGYPGSALGITSNQIPVSILLSDEGTSLPLDKDLLAKAARTIKAVDASANHPGRLSVMAQGSEIFAPGLKQGWIHNAIPPNQCYSFSSDGPAERRMDTVFKDASGREVFELSKSAWLSVNHIDPGPSCRIQSLNRIIELSIEYNANLVSDAEIDQLLAKWKEFLLLVTKFEEKDY